MITAYREPDRKTGRALMTKLIGSLSRSLPRALTGITTLGRTLKKRAADVWPTSTGRHQQRNHRSLNCFGFGSASCRRLESCHVSTHRSSVKSLGVV